MMLNVERLSTLRESMAEKVTSASAAVECCAWYVDDLACYLMSSSTLVGRQDHPSQTRPTTIDTAEVDHCSYKQG